MGGFNSGRRSGTPTVEDGHTLDLARLLRQGLAVPGALSRGSIVWTTTTGERRGTVGYEADLTTGDTGRMRLRYAAAGKPQDYFVSLTTTPCHYGGQRWWFLCPSSGRRCRKLHLPPGGTIFAARQAYRLAYRSQRTTPMDRSHARQRRLYARLGGEYEYFEQPPPRRPKGMRRATYERTVNRIIEARERHDEIFMAGAARFIGRVRSNCSR